MKIRTTSILVCVALVLAVISFWVGQQAYSWFPPQATAESELIDKLFSFLVTLGTFIFLGVTGTLTYSILFHQAGKYDISDGPPIEGNVTLEIVWTAIPFLLVFWIATYSYQIYGQMAITGPMEHVHIGMADANAAPISKAVASQEDIEVFGRQWAWEFRYPQQNVTSTELHLPVNKRIRLALHSEDVIHGFYIPAFRLKQDIIPKQVTNFEFTPTRVGKYRLRDSQFSGTYFAVMQTDVVVESPEDYSQWLNLAAKHQPVPAYNQAFAEYDQESKQVITGWASVVPASPPIVNYPTSK